MTNNKLNVILVDDEERSLKLLRTLLEKFCPEVNVVAMGDGIDSAEKLIREHQPDLVFLDIQMPEGTAFDLLRRFGTKLPFQIVFVTSYSHYALTAIKFSALDYLLKPVEVADLQRAVQRAVENLEATGTAGKQIINLLQNLDSNAIEKSITVHENEQVVFVRMSTVTHIEASDRYSFLYTENGEKHLLTKTLRDFEEFLADNEAFIRISKTVILNLNFVKEYSKGEPCFVSLKSGQAFEIPRRKKHEVLAKLKIKF